MWSIGRCAYSFSTCFSALQRAENSSIVERPALHLPRHRVFQCSSASRKFLNTAAPPRPQARSSVSVLFSEPKIPQSAGDGERSGSSDGFQCSSASRKFLNALVGADDAQRGAGFSALQRAENSSIKWVRKPARLTHPFQCSSASRKFLNIAPV